MFYPPTLTNMPSQTKAARPGSHLELIQYDWHPYIPIRKKNGHRHIQRKEDGKTQGEVDHLEVSEEASKETNPADT